MTCSVFSVFWSLEEFERLFIEELPSLRYEFMYLALQSTQDNNSTGPPKVFVIVVENGNLHM